MFFQATQDPDHTQAWLTFAGVIFAAVVPLWVKDKLDKRKQKYVVEDSDFEVKFSLEDLVEIRAEVGKIFEKTKADRFLILKAENGKSSPKWATAIYEQHRGVPVVLATTAYKKVRIDDKYREMIEEAERREVSVMHTVDMPKSRLKAIYEAEGVTHSNCYFLCRYPLKSDAEKWVVIYCTTATKDDVEFTPHEETALGLFADKLRNMFATEVDHS